jgi:hypothetical protein
MDVDALMGPSLVQVMLILAGLLAAMLVAIEVGYRAGAALRKRQPKQSGLDLGTIQGAVLGLLGLLLAFTYSYVSGRAEMRKQAVVEEANAIGTAYLRTQLMAEPIRSELREALRVYAQTRIIDDEVAGNREKFQVAVTASAQAQDKLWPIVAKLDGKKSTPADALMIAAVNEVLDMHTRRVAATRDRLPAPVFLLIVFVAVVSVGITGYAGGLVGHHNGVLNTTLAVLITGVVLVILDLDLPRAGFLQVSQESLRELVRGMAR